VWGRVGGVTVECRGGKGKSDLKRTEQKIGVH